MSNKTNTIGRLGKLVLGCQIFVLWGCANIPADLGRDHVNQIVRKSTQLEPLNQLGDLDAVLKQALSVDESVRIALANNPQLRLKLADLGFGAADVYQAARIRNPILSASLFNSTESGAQDQLTLGIAASFTDLLTLRARLRLAKSEFAALKQQVAHAALGFVKHTRSAYFEYAAAQEIAVLRTRAAYAADVSYRLAKRFFDAGNLTSRELNLAEAQAVEAKLASLSADASSAASRAALSGWLGLDASAPWQIEPGIELPSEAEHTYDELLTRAQNSRLDLQAAKMDARSVAQAYGLTQWSRWIDEFEVGYERERETDGSRLTGPTVAWGLPLISQNRDQVLRAEARVQQASITLEETGLAISNEVWLAYQGWRNATAKLALISSRLVPARQQATVRAQEEEAFMLIGVFDVLDSKQREFDALEAYIDGLKNHWIAYAELSYALGTTLDGVRSGTVFEIADQFTESPGSATHHHHHSHQQRHP